MLSQMTENKGIDKKINSINNSLYLTNYSLINHEFNKLALEP